jgi:uncharacterized protein (DUF2147 family)
MSTAGRHHQNIIKRRGGQHHRNSVVSFTGMGGQYESEYTTVEHSLEVEVYKQDNKFRAKIIWFKIEDKTRPMNTRLDEKNPNPKLRNRKWLGMEVLRNLKYSAEDNEWEDGIIYDAKHGREWDSVAWINNQGLLKVKGYWIFQWISETLTFIKVI